MTDSSSTNLRQKSKSSVMSSSKENSSFTITNIDPSGL
uniref:Uncharacterized protein n=1 Tax=Rhizophora mucronata TaxID=61149 RepID=A0A2P2PEM7_RHIMU